MPGTLRMRIVTGMVAVNAVIMLFFIAYLIHHQRGSLEAVQRIQVQDMAHNLADAAAPWMSAKDLAGLQELVDGLKRNPKVVYAMLVDERGRVFAHTDPDRRNQFVQDLPDPGVPMQVVDHGEIVDAIVPCALGSTQLGWARIGFSHALVKEELAAATRYGLLCGLLSTLLIGLLSAGIGQALSVFEAQVAQGSSALADSERRFRGAFETAPHGMALVAPSGRFLKVNPALCALLGYEEADLLATDFQAITHPEDLDEDLAQVQALLAGDQDSYHVEKRYFHKSGRSIWVLLSVSLVRNEQGAPVHFVSQVQDLTERKLGEERQRQIDAQVVQFQKAESLGVLTGGIAHDFNNLMAAIMANAEMAARAQEEQRPSQRSLAAILKCAQRAADLTSQMLAYSGQGVVGHMAFKPLDLSTQIQDMKGLLHSSCPPVATLSFDLAENLPAFTWDPGQIQQAILGLVVNAGEALPGGVGEIGIRTRARVCSAQELESVWVAAEHLPGTYLELTVQDDGEGIEPDQLPRIFDPFFSTKFTGRGLGLAAVLGIVKAARGSIQVQSVLGQGSTFRVLLPADPP